MRRTLITALLLVGTGLLLSGWWIPLKAELAQWLIERAWHGGNHPGRPWPWADTRPFARLRVPGQGKAFYVLEGDSGRSLAFGPGWSPASARPGEPGTTLISAHRDTQFAFMQRLGRGDVLQLEYQGRQYRYRVTGMQIIDADRTALRSEVAGHELVLSTCYPFDAVVPGGPLRYLVRAVYVGNGS